MVHHYASDLAHARWLSGAQLPAKRGAPAIRYGYEQDEFWGCGGTEKLVAYRGDRAIDTLASSIHTSAWPIALAQNAVAAYALYNDELHRLRGTHATPIDTTYIQELIGVDRYGALIASYGPLLLRWSERGGWRILTTTTTP